ncbi:MAG: sulfotransferase family 2 domain-containing protein [cyanobacterium endosymbiont of Rhopalodia musculus]|uniref:sulfotransferase family 2 domain-containing protein n=1 Tax=cyanobacterium endosymbiont of Epithemia clementina EcSB TaxID=3034674 RepID=UPI0024812076|nr:sulfotransferase family 2 domain-containing protein [cyanobacterium endosymbiont of Epithemia clementina EcSB]WGT68163.1 sulfotransferase family 2 domain-containing protein [cyanobacterium endosymbiont of Epithemia clementina EcSB]
MLSVQKRFLFIHVPKTAGNSVQNVLQHYSEDKIVTHGEHQDGVERFEVRNDVYEVIKHSTLKHYQEILEVDLYQKLFKFATIRNPYDHMISWYFSPHRGIQNWVRQDFIDLIEEVPNLREYITFSSNSFLGKKLKKLGLSINFNRKKLDEDIDFLMRFEHLNEDFQKVCEIIDIPYQPLPVRNRSNRKHYSIYFDEVLKEKVYTKFQEEIEWGNYKFEQVKY